MFYMFIYLFYYDCTMICFFLKHDMVISYYPWILFFTYLKFRLRRGDVVPPAIHVWLSLWSVGTSEMGVIPSLPMVPSGKTNIAIENGHL